ncbi:hypothetical protein B0P06_003824 [Clostridium saccharoperbutylacetonicum]|uniref:WXG100 family type VII secretion target n=1 Tax=Clostridium saccharoperbutylacetonicum N1-4(HMT) TaxID=931276 RepID=M1MT24_9CLOT|nr:hypothetical protein [Clostridium saccharoperbutylacetonicum]AGF57866.1 hypothetical protein Cspa_c41130 [Clostridium saccharoperbutylacetonicum N1-4(HMT)]NRT61361.1 hypothetical protein [Clostridium saccharoperbutylacetonicum]NSB24679.1 hypothetical protein [Clostridium saccharoperbutylacetonicum]NSB44053.1 hypothetical protein [Clostridium saccharoperbutylacetonicum]
MDFKVDLGKLTGTISGHDHVMSILAEQKAIVKGALNELYQGGWSGAARDKFEAAHKTREEKYTLLETEVKFMKEVLTYVEKATAVSLKKDCENFINYIDRCGIGNGVTGPDTGLISFYGDTAQINRNISNCVDKDYKDILKNMDTISDIISNLEFTSFDIGGDISGIEKSISDQTTSLTEFEEAFNKYYNGVNELENKVCGEFSKLSGITDYKTFEKSSVITANGEIDKNNLEKMLKENSGELSDETKETLIYLCRVLGKDKFNDLIKEIEADEKEKQKQANINKDILNLLKDNIKDGLKLDILGQAEDTIKNLKSLYGDIGADEYLKSNLGEENYNKLVAGIDLAEGFIDDPLKDMNKLNDYLENSETGQYLKENNKLLYDKLKMKLVRQEALTVDVINMGKGILSLHDLLKYNNDVNSDFMEIQVEKALGINGMDNEATYKKALEANQKDMENAMNMSWDIAKGIVPGIINDVKNTLDPKNAWDFFTNPDMKLEDAQKWSQSAINTAMTVDGVRAGLGFVKGKISGITKVGSEVGLETSLEEGANASKTGKIKAEIDTNLENIKNEEISSADLELKDINKEIEVDHIKNIDKSEIDINNKEIEVEAPVKDEVETLKLGNNVEVETPVIGNVVDTARETEVPKVDKEVVKDIESENVKDGTESSKYSEISESHPIVEDIKSDTSIENIRKNKDLILFEETFSKAMKNENMMMDEYIKLTHTPMSELSETDIKRIYAVNNSVDNPTNATLMSKVIPEKTYLNCIENGKFSDTVGNCVTRAQDMQDCYTFDDYYNKLGLNYGDNPFDTADKMYVMRYTSQDTEALVTRSYGGTTLKDVKAAQNVLGLNENNTFLNSDPYLGTGVTKDVEGGIGKMELMTIKDNLGNAQYCTVDDGSAIYEVARESNNERLIAIRYNKRWWKVK